MSRLLTLTLLTLAALPPAHAEFRPPAVPLVVHNPYFSVWSMGDTLHDDQTKHWTGVPHPLHSKVRIDGRTFRLMGSDPRHPWRNPAPTEALPQIAVRVLPTRSAYEFLNETPDRVPMTDWYWTHDGRRRGFQARSVVGGVFIKLLANEDVWRKWAVQ